MDYMLQRYPLTLMRYFADISNPMLMLSRDLCCCILVGFTNSSTDSDKSKQCGVKRNRNSRKMLQSIFFGSWSVTNVQNYRCESTLKPWPLYIWKLQAWLIVLCPLLGPVHTTTGIFQTTAFSMQSGHSSNTFIGFIQLSFQGLMNHMGETRRQTMHIQLHFSNTYLPCMLDEMDFFLSSSK